LATVIAALIQGEDRDDVLSADWKSLRHLNEIKLLHPPYWVESSIPGPLISGLARFDMLENALAGIL
jgi:hypothetical protein